MANVRIKTFWIERSGVASITLRRYLSGSECGFPGKVSYCQGIAYLGQAPAVADERGFLASLDKPPRSDPRWPVQCGSCGKDLPDTTQWQINQKEYYRAPDGKIYLLPEAPVGAMWDSFWMSDSFKGHDGISLTVKLPGNQDWMVDGRAKNCTMPDDWEHRCWTRAGDPKEGLVDVSKKHGPTCAAGAGSILIPGFHGFLRDGYIVG